MRLEAIALLSGKGADSAPSRQLKIQSVIATEAGRLGEGLGKLNSFHFHIGLGV